MSSIPSLPLDANPIYEIPESPASALLKQHGLATPKNCKKLQELEILDEGNPNLSYVHYRIDKALASFSRAELLDEPNLTRFFGLDSETRQNLSGALNVFELDRRPGQGILLLDQRILTAMFDHPEQDWHSSVDSLWRNEILNRDILGGLTSPENAAHATSIVNGLSQLEKIRSTGRHIEDSELEKYRAAVIDARQYALSLGQGLRMVHDFGRDQDVYEHGRGFRCVRESIEVREYISERVKNALLADAEHAEIIASGLSRLINAGSRPQGLGMLETYWEKLLNAEEHADTLAEGLVELHRRKLHEQSWAIFYVHPRYAQDVAIGLSTLLLYSALRKNEGCIYAMLAGETRGEHVRRIFRELGKIGYQATLEQFNDIIANLPTPKPLMK